jgi:hypothetical protein
MNQDSYSELNQQYKNIENHDFTESVKILDQTIDIGVKTVEVLETQGEQINHINKLLDGINVNIQASNKSMAKINNFGYSFTKFFRPSYWKNKNLASSQIITDVIPENTHEINNIHEKINETLSTERNENNNDFYKQMSSRLDILKDIVILQGIQLGEHNKLLNDVNPKMDKSNEEIIKLNKDILGNLDK